MDKVIVGLDIAKDKLEVATSQGLLTAVANTAAGHRRLLALLPAGATAVMEATGTYHLHLAHRLLDAGHPVSVVNPLQVRRFAQMKLSRVKTDRSDARLLVRYGEEQPLVPYRAPLPHQQHLKQLNTLIDQLTKQRTMTRNQLHAQSYVPGSHKAISQLLRQTLKYQDRQLARAYAEQAQLVKAHFDTQARLMGSIKGIGQKTTLALLAYAGDLSRFESAKQLVAYMGLNPVPYESGTLVKRGRISKQGNARLRTLFYLCALSAIRSNTACRRLYHRLLKRGKLKKQALIAVAGKLVRQVFAVVKSGVPYQDDYAAKKLHMT